MKNLKNMLGLLVAMVFAFVAVGTVYAASGDVTVTIDGTTTPYSDLGTALGTITAGKSAVVEIKADISSTASNIGTITSGKLAVGGTTEQTVTIRLNGHTIEYGTNIFEVTTKGTLKIVGAGELHAKPATSTALFTVKGGSLVVNGNVTINTSDVGNVAKISAGATSASKSVVTFGPDTVVDTTDTAGSNHGKGIEVEEAAKYTTVNIAGEWNVASGELLTVSGGTASKSASAPVINLASGGLYTAAGNVVKIGGYVLVNIKGGTFTSETEDLINVDNISTLNITGGNFVTEVSDQYALDIAADATSDSIAKNIIFNISAGTFKSGEDSSDEDGAILPAIRIASERVLKYNEGHVTGGVFHKGVANYVLSTAASDGQIPATTVSNTLTKGATATSSNGKVTVKTGSAATDPEEDPNEQKPNTDDNQPNENPKTFDAIGSLIAMAVSSLGVVGTATKKVLK